MSRGGQLIKNTVIISFGTFFPKLLAIISLPIITAGLTKAEYGTYDLVSILETLLIPFVTLQIHTAAFRFLIECRKDEERKAEIVSSMVGFVFFTLGISLAVLFFCLKALSIPTRILICLFFLFNTQLLMLQQLARGQDHTLAYSISAVIQSAVNVIFIVLCIKVRNMGLNGALLAMTASAAVATVYLTFGEKSLLLFRVSKCKKTVVREMVQYSWPMIPNSLSMWVMNVSDRLVLTAALGLEANAIYAVANKIPSLFTIVQSTFTFAWQENASIVSKDEDAGKYYSSVFDVVFCIMAGVMALLIAGTPLLFALLIKGDYNESYYQMPILFLGVFFSCLTAFLGGIYIAHKKTKNVGVTTTIAAGVNLLIDIAMVNYIGIYAASVSTLISYIFLTAYRLYDIQKFQKMHLNWKKILFGIEMLLIMCFLSSQRKVFLDVINILVALVFSLWINRKIVFRMVEMIVKKVGGRKR